MQGLNPQFSLNGVNDLPLGHLQLNKVFGKQGLQDFLKHELYVYEIIFGTTGNHYSCEQEA